MEAFADMEPGQVYGSHDEKKVQVMFELLQDGTKRFNTINAVHKDAIIAHPTLITVTQLRALQAIEEGNTEAIQKEISKYL